MTLQDIRQAAKGGYALVEATDHAFLTDAQWNRAINRGYRWLCQKARLISGKWTGAAVATTASDQEIAISGLSPGLAGIDFVLFKQQGTTWGKLRKLPADQLAGLAAQFHDQTGSPTHYYLRGSDALGFYPIPDATNAGQYVEIWGWAYPTSLSADGNSPAIDSNLHDFLIAPAQYEMAKQELARGRPDAARLVQLYDAERAAALLECKSYVQLLSDEPDFFNVSYEDDY